MTTSDFLERVAELNRLLNPPLNEPEMVERVARALCKDRDGWRKRQDFIDGQWHLHIGAARAAIEAMREPTSVMANAVDIEVGGDFEVAGSFVGSYEAVQIWHAMISAALQPPEAGKP